MRIKVSLDEYYGQIHLKYIMYILRTENWRSVSDLPGLQETGPLPYNGILSDVTATGSVGQVNVKPSICFFNPNDLLGDGS